jgi:hypothetical protein
MCCSPSFLICSVLLYLSGQPIYMLIFPGWVIIINYCLCLFCTHFVFVIGFVFVYDYLVSVVTIFQLETSQVFCVLFYSVLNFHNCVMCCNPAPFRLLPHSFISPLSRHLVVLLRGPLLVRLSFNTLWRVQRPACFVTSLHGAVGFFRTEVLRKVPVNLMQFPFLCRWQPINVR